MIIRRPGDNDRTSGDEPTTYHSLASADLALEGTGRYAQDTRVVGATPTVNYPAASGPWAGADLVGLEPPTGEDITRVEPVGEAHEIAASIERIERKRGDV